MHLQELAAKLSFELTRTPPAPRRTQRDCVLHGFRFAAAGYADNQVFTCIPDGASDRVVVSQFPGKPGFGGRSIAKTRWQGTKGNIRNRTSRLLRRSVLASGLLSFYVRDLSLLSIRASQFWEGRLPAPMYTMPRRQNSGAFNRTGSIFLVVL